MARKKLSLEEEVFQVDIFYSHLDYLIGLCSARERTQKALAEASVDERTEAFVDDERVALEIDRGLKALWRHARERLALELLWAELCGFERFAETSVAFRELVEKEVRTLRLDNANKAKALRCKPKLLRPNDFMGLFMLQKYKVGEARRERRRHREPRRRP